MTRDFTVEVLMFKQDDPRKCTAAKLVRFGMAKDVKRSRAGAIVLDPFALQFLIPSEKTQSRTLAAIDCSWNLTDEVFAKKFTGLCRRLPPLLAGNPVNYAKLGKLTTVEAISGALYILGCKEQSMRLLDKFKWGHTFYDLNRNLLDDYACVESEHQIKAIASDYGLAP